MTKLAVVTLPPAAVIPNTPARRALASALAAKASANAVYADTAAPVTATSGLIAQEATARAALDDMHRRNAEFVAEWAKGGATGSPDVVEAVEVAALQQELTLATANAAAARLALPGLQSKMDAARAEATAARDVVEQAVRAVLVEDATAIDAEIAMHLDRVTALRAQLYGLGLYSQRLPQSANLTNDIRRLIERYPTEPTDAVVITSQNQWRSLADRLASDATATIQPE